MLNIAQKKCVWEKYVDPLNSNLEEVEWPGFDGPNNADKIEYYDFSEGDTTAVKDRFDEEFMRNLRRQIHSIRPLKIVNTKMGLLTITENAVADYHFDFWILHTNFDISEDVGKVICEVPGVDAFMPMTRYRCKIGFTKSKLFDNREVKIEIVRRITDPKIYETIGDTIKPIFDSETQGKIDAKIGELKTRNKYWALYVLPNGGMEVLESDAASDTFKSKLRIFEESQKLAGGQIFKY